MKKTSLQKKSAIIYLIAAAASMIVAATVPTGKKNINKASAPASAVFPAMTVAKADLLTVAHALKLQQVGKKIGNEASAKTTSSANSQEEQQKEAAAKLAALPLMFRKNMGQWDTEILYQGNSQGKHVTIMKDKVSFCSTREIEEGEENEAAEKKEAGAIHDEETGDGDEYQHLVWNLHFKGMNTNAVITAEGEAESHTNYLFGNDPSKWIVNVPDVKIVKYRNIYNNIDLHYYGRPNNELEYDYIIQPGGKVEDIQMQLEGVKGLSINENGELEITTDWGVVKEKAPVAYQNGANERRQPTPTRYRLINENTFGFAVAGSYNKNAQLVIDPVSMVWATWVGGADGSSVNYSYAITVDGSGNSYITGKGISSYPTTPGAFSTTASSGTSVFVTKINTTGTAPLVYSTFLGTTGNSIGNAIAVNAAGEAFVTGQTNSASFPTFPAGAFQTTLTGCSFGICTWGAFVTRLNAAGSALVYSTFLRGVTSGTSRGDGIAVLADEAYVTGTTNSANFPTSVGAYRTALSGSTDAFVTKLNTGGTNYVYSTYLGGTGGEGGKGIAVNSAGQAFVIGYTNSTVAGGFATTAGVIQPAAGGLEDGFVTKFNAAGTALVYSTFLGGSGDDVQGNGTGLTAGAIAINSADEAFVSGITESTNFPTTAGAYKTVAPGGTSDAFVTKLNSTGGAGYSTYLGGTLMDVAYGIAINPAGEAYVSGHTMSSDFPTLTPFDATYNGGCCGSGDVFVTTVKADGSGILCSSYVGGSAQEYGAPEVAVRPGNPDTVLVTVTTHSTDFPVTAGVFQGPPTKPNGASDDPAVFKMLGCAITPLSIQLLSFTGSCVAQNSILLHWSTASETNNDYFTIERATSPNPSKGGGLNWEVAGTVKGAGNSSTVRSYEFTDNQVLLFGEDLGGVVYYRLTQTDFDGKTEVFNNQQVAVDVTECAVQVFPNPAGNTLNVPYAAQQDGEITLQVYDVIGKLVKEKTVVAIKGNNKFTLDLTTVAQGMYVLRVKGTAKESNQKFVKQTIVTR